LVSISSRPASPRPAVEGVTVPRQDGSHHSVAQDNPGGSVIEPSSNTDSLVLNPRSVSIHDGRERSLYYDLSPGAGSLIELGPNESVQALVRNTPPRSESSTPTLSGCSTPTLLGNSRRSEYFTANQSPANASARSSQSSFDHFSLTMELYKLQSGRYNEQEDRWSLHTISALPSGQVTPSGARPMLPEAQASLSARLSGPSFARSASGAYSFGSAFIGLSLKRHDPAKILVGSYFMSL
jgi:hypothetical protein